MSAHDMTPEQALDASIAAVSGAIARSPKEVERGVQFAELILGQIRWRGYDPHPSPHFAAAGVGLKRSAFATAWAKFCISGVRRGSGIFGIRS